MVSTWFALSWVILSLVWVGAIVLTRTKKRKKGATVTIPKFKKSPTFVSSKSEGQVIGVEEIDNPDRNHLKITKKIGTRQEDKEIINCPEGVVNWGNLLFSPKDLMFGDNPKVIVMDHVKMLGELPKGVTKKDFKQSPFAPRITDLTKKIDELEKDKQHIQRENIGLKEKLFTLDNKDKWTEEQLKQADLDQIKRTKAFAFKMGEGEMPKGKPYGGG